MRSMLSAKPAILAHFEPFGIVFLVFHGIVVSLLALRAGHCDFYSHHGTSINIGNDLPKTVDLSGKTI